MSRVPNMGSAEKVVLLKLTENGPGTWSCRDSRALYESRALTEMVCQRLVSRGYLDEVRDNGKVTYRLNQIGANAAHDLAAEFYRFPLPDGT